MEENMKDLPKKQAEIENCCQIRGERALFTKNMCFLESTWWNRTPVHKKNVHNVYLNVLNVGNV